MSLKNSLPMVHRLCWIATCALCLIVPVPRATAAEVLYLARAGGTSQTQQQVETAARFYGFDLETRPLRSRRDVSAAQNLIAAPGTLALVIDAEALSALDLKQVFTATQRGSQRIPVLIAGIHARISPVLLKNWSAGAVAASQRSDGIATGWEEVGPPSDVTRQLSGSRLPLRSQPLNYLVLGTTGAPQQLIAAKLGNASLPLFVGTRNGAQETFFATEVQPSDIPLTPDPYRQQPIFAAIAAPMMFLRHAGGDRAWHSPSDFANFTIDDLWLREPYGHVNYRALLEQMQQHNFHTTIAFIPWNFDRSQPELVSLFQANPDRLSICIHGNNHVHQEFGPLDSHPLTEQARNIDQGLARMERFKQLTRLPYDAVMVFPHSISPQKTLAALKQANFLATANSLNVPSDAQAPANIDFALRTATLDFAGFPSLRRYSAESDIPLTQLAIDAFLGNPMLFYAHESYFANGIDAFDKLADSVNHLQPGIQWRSLGEIVQHLYLERLRADGDFDIRAFSSSIRLNNSSSRDRNFFVAKDENFNSPVTVSVDGQSWPFERAGTQLHLRLAVPSGGSRLIEVRYGGATKLAVVDTAKSSPRVAAIRLLSDFRDNEVSSSSLGRWFIRSYAAFGKYWNGGLALVASFIAFVLAATFYQRRVRNVALIAPDPSLSGGSN